MVFSGNATAPSSHLRHSPVRNFFLFQMVTLSLSIRQGRSQFFSPTNPQLVVFFAGEMAPSLCGQLLSEPWLRCRRRIKPLPRQLTNGGVFAVSMGPRPLPSTMPGKSPVGTGPGTAVVFSGSTTEIL